jgi:hypothetical protein
VHRANKAISGQLPQCGHGADAVLWKAAPEALDRGVDAGIADWPGVQVGEVRARFGEDQIENILELSAIWERVWVHGARLC